MTEWRLIDVQDGESAIIEILADGAVLRFRWVFEESADGDTRIENRRQFLKGVFMFAATLPLITTSSSCHAQSNRRAATTIVGGGCDGCEGIYENMPQELSWDTAIASAAEPGERMEISGAVYKLGGQTPAPGVILYVYHTDAQGYYSPASNMTGLARRHGHLRGWVKTNLNGEYKFTTIKPAPYPNANIPAHIHPIIKEPDKNEYYIDEYVFDDDPLLTNAKRVKLENRGGSGIVHPTRRSDGAWIGRRNIILGLNIPNYR